MKRINTLVIGICVVLAFSGANHAIHLSSGDAVSIRTDIGRVNVTDDGDNLIIGVLNERNGIEVFMSWNKRDASFAFTRHHHAGERGLERILIDSDGDGVVDRKVVPGLPTRVFLASVEWTELVSSSEKRDENEPTSQP